MTLRIINDKIKCRTCGKTKPTSEYHVNNRNKCGLDSRCKKCTHKYVVEYYKNLPEEKKKERFRKHREWVYSHPEKIKEYKKSWASLTDDEKKRKIDYQRAYRNKTDWYRKDYIKNKDRIKERKRLYHEKLGIEEVRRRQREYNKTFYEKTKSTRSKPNSTQSLG